MKAFMGPGWEHWDDEEEDGEDAWLEEARAQREETSEELLTLEQRLTIRQVAEEAQTMSREELIHALLLCWEQRFGEKMAFAEAAYGLGMPVKTSGLAFARQPRTRKDFIEIFGYEPTPQQAMEYLDEMEETATMELDMERIVDSVE
jgi:hypothetical protein